MRVIQAAVLANASGSRKLAAESAACHRSRAATVKDRVDGRDDPVVRLVLKPLSRRAGSQHLVDRKGVHIERVATNCRVF